MPEADFFQYAVRGDVVRMGDGDNRIDGEPAGVVRGRWGFKPYDVSDITLELPRAGRAARKREILAAVAAEYPPPRHRILRYDGRRV